MQRNRAWRWLGVEGTLAATAFGGLLVVANPAPTARLLEIPIVPWANRLFDGGLLVAGLALVVLALRLLQRLALAGRRWRTARGEPRDALLRAEAGTAMVEFLMVLPFVWIIMGMVVQLALLANASLVVRYAAFAAARSAIVSMQFRFPISSSGFDIPQEALDFEPEKIDRAAYMVLASISPFSGTAPVGAADAAAGLTMQHIQNRRGGVWQDPRYADRLSYAIAATSVTSIEERVRQRDSGFTADFNAYAQSLPPLIPKVEHLIPPGVRGMTEQEVAAGFADLIDQEIAVAIQKLGASGTIGGFQLDGIAGIIQGLIEGLMSSVNLSPPSFSLPSFPIPPWLEDIYDSLNRNPFSPKRVEIEVKYKFFITIPGISLLPGLTERAPAGLPGYTFTISQTVELQSTGARQAGLMAFVPFEGNTPLFWKEPSSSN